MQSELAATIKEMVTAEVRARSRGRAGAIRAARDAFYRGDIAARIADYHAREGGLLTREDLAEFQAEVAPALRTSFHDYEVAACGFWCQGPVFLQMLNLIEAYDWPALGHNTPRGLHLMVEAMKLAFADREAYYGDPRFVKVPAEALLSKAYAELRRGLIREDRAWPDMPPPGDPEGKAAVRNGHGAASKVGAPSHAGTLDTSYVSVIDAEGNAFSATPSDPGGVRAARVPVIGLPGFPAPRTAVAYMLVCAVEIAALAGAAPRIHTEIDAAAAFLAEQAGGLQARAAEIAAKLDGTLPVVYGADLTAPVARRWKTQINENAKTHAAFSELPEADHNELCGWAGAETSGSRFSAVFLEDADQHPRERRRFELTAEAVAASGAEVVRAETAGETRVARLLWAVMLGDLVSLKLAEGRGVDPLPVEAIEGFKTALGRP